MCRNSALDVSFNFPLLASPLNLKNITLWAKNQSTCFIDPALGVAYDESFFRALFRRLAVLFRVRVARGNGYSACSDVDVVLDSANRVVIKPKQSGFVLRPNVEYQVRINGYKANTAPGLQGTKPEQVIWATSSDGCGSGNPGVDGDQKYCYFGFITKPDTTSSTFSVHERVFIKFFSIFK